MNNYLVLILPDPKVYNNGDPLTFITVGNSFAEAEAKALEHYKKVDGLVKYEILQIIIYN